MNWETHNLSPIARKQLIDARINYTPDKSSPLNRQGTVALTGEHSKKLRREEAKVMIRQREEKEAAKAEEAQRKEEEKVAFHNMAIAVRVMYTGFSTTVFSENITMVSLTALVRTYWVVEYVKNFKGTFPRSWNGSIIERQSSLNKDSLLEYARIILQNDKELDDVREYDNENIDEHIQFLANKKQTKDNAQSREQAAQAKKRQRDEEEERQNAPLHTIVDTSSRGRQRRRTDFGGGK